MKISPYVYPDLAGQKRCNGINKPKYGEMVEYIETLVTSHFGQTVKGIKKRGRERLKVLCRHVCFHLIHRSTHLSLKEIGIRFGGRDHTTVIHGLNTLKDLMFSDEKLRADVQLLEAKIDERN